MDDLAKLIGRLNAAYVRDKVTKKVCQFIHVKTDQRIFRDGIDANSKLIGVYSPEYMKTRRRKGYPTSRKVILQATNQMVNDYKLLVLPQNKYGSGFSNNSNFKKSYWVEDTYKKDIFKLTSNEEKILGDVLEIELSKLLNV